jgi:octaprenyl-diphosphate synthase
MKRLKFYSPGDFPTYLPKLSQLYDDLLGEGKGFRSALVARAAEPIKLAPELIHLLGQTVEFIHNASLLHDDLIDRSQLRRGKPAAWTKFTPEYAVLGGDYLLARVMVNLSAHGNVKLIHYTAQMISDLLEGEWLQDSLIRDFNINIEDLDRVHGLKTGSLFKWCLKAPFIAANSLDPKIDLALEEAGTLLGLLFQRSDDLLDFDIRNAEGKAVLGDLKSGYLNSFGAFLIREMAASERLRFVASQSLGELQSVVGESIYAEKLKKFDDINSQKIKLYEHHIDRVSENLGGASGEIFSKNLRMICQQLYWRKK